MIIVFGSLNMDMSVRLEKLPEPGETVLTPGYELNAGGKGANQALAALRAGADKVALVGKVGDDHYGRNIREGLKREGVMVSGVAQSDQPTGTALTAVDSHGDNQIIVMSGANSEATHDQVPDEILTPQNLLLMQMELPVDQTMEILERANARGCKTILNLAPAVKIPKRAIGHLDYLIVNSIEARQIAEKLQLTAEKDATKIAQALAVQGQLTCIVTLGKRGSVAVTKDGHAWAVPILEIDQSQIVDITGAGDAYCGTFAAAIYKGLSVPEAMRRASVAGTLVCLKSGAQPALPYLAEIEERLSELPAAESVRI